MEHTLNGLGQPVGVDLPGWTAPTRPPREPIDGRYCRIVPLDPERHAQSLYSAFGEAADARLWTYLPYGPFASFEEYVSWLRASCLGIDPLFFAVVELDTGRALGVASYLRIDPAAGCIEVGHICYSPRLQRTTAATEAMYLLMGRAFELGYRRYEWKCDALNSPSRAAAERLGFAFEGIFRQATVYKGRNRDTAWYSVVDSEWPALRAELERWLDPANFDERGRQRTHLEAASALRRPGASEAEQEALPAISYAPAGQTAGGDIQGLLLPAAESKRPDTHDRRRGDRSRRQHARMRLVRRLVAQRDRPIYSNYVGRAAR